MRLVMKFGGISLANGDRIKHVANLVNGFIDDGNEICVVVVVLVAYLAQNFC